MRDAPRPFDAILLDIVMGRSDGAEICNKLRKLRGASLPIIAMTSLTDLEHRERFEQMGFDMVRGGHGVSQGRVWAQELTRCGTLLSQVLAKPFNKDTLGQALVAGRQKRGNTRFKRMSARLDEDRQRPSPNSAMPKHKGPIPMLPSIPDHIEEDSDEDEDNGAGAGQSAAVQRMMVTGDAASGTPQPDSGGDEDDDDDLVMQPSHINAAVEAAATNQAATIVIQ